MSVVVGFVALGGFPKRFCAFSFGQRSRKTLSFAGYDSNFAGEVRFLALFEGNVDERFEKVQHVTVIIKLILIFMCGIFISGNLCISYSLMFSAFSKA